MGTAQFAMMKPTATLINMARGPVVNTDALLEALTVGRIESAALDVFDPEPLPRDHPLNSLDNVIMTPHRLLLPLSPLPHDHPLNSLDNVILTPHRLLLTL